MEKIITIITVSMGSYSNHETANVCATFDREEADYLLAEAEEWLITVERNIHNVRAGNRNGTIAKALSTIDIVTPNWITDIQISYFYLFDISFDFVEIPVVGE